MNLDKFSVIPFEKRNPISASRISYIYIYRQREREREGMKMHSWCRDMRVRVSVFEALLNQPNGSINIYKERKKKKKKGERKSKSKSKSKTSLTILTMGSKIQSLVRRLRDRRSRSDGRLAKSAITQESTRT